MSTERTSIHADEKRTRAAEIQEANERALTAMLVAGRRGDWTVGLELTVPPGVPERWRLYDDLFTDFLRSWPYSSQWARRHVDEVDCWPWGWLTDHER